MKSKYISYLTALCIVVLTGGIIFAQDLPFQGLKGNKEYVELIRQTHALRKAEDSLQILISRSRTLFENRTGNTDAYANEIVKLEGELYDIRSEGAKLGTRIAQIEQDFISRGIDRGNAPDSADTVAPVVEVRPRESRNLYQNDFFTANVPMDDLKAMTKSAQAETIAASVKSDVDKFYRQLSDLKSAYDQTESQEEADRMLVEANSLIGQLRGADKELLEDWVPLYNLKIDTYMVLLDKIGNTDRLQLEKLDQQGRNVRRSESLAAEQQFAPNTSVFPLQKEFALAYEILLAAKLDLKLAQDSLSKALAAMPKARPEYPRIDFKPRNLIVYSPVTLDAKYSYSSVDSIPILRVPAKGVYYAVSVATMTKPPAELSFFKGGQPLQKEVLADGRLRYTLGGFTNYADAQKTVSQLLKAGYKAPVTVAWLDGVSTTALKAKAAEATAPKVTAGKFKIEITTTDINFSQVLREIVDQNSPGKQISRVTEGNNFIFTISQYTTREEAELIVKIIESRGETETEIIAIE